MTNKYKLRSKRVYSKLVKKGMFSEASRLLRALINGCEFISIGLNDTDWNLSYAFGDKFFGLKSIRIR